LLTSDPNVDPSSAMMTNLSLLHTRTVSEDVVKDLHLPMSAEDFGSTVTAGELSDQLMTVTVTAPSDQEAIKRVTTLASDYLAFRGQQMNALATSTIQTNTERIDTLKQQVASLNTKYQQATAAGQQTTAATYYSQLSQMRADIASAEQQNLDT